MILAVARRAHVPHALTTATTTLRRDHWKWQFSREFSQESASYSSDSPVENEQLSLLDGAFTLPNVLSSSRLALVPALCWLVNNSRWEEACAISAVAALTDWADGAIARRFSSQRSLLGSYLDPLADKALVGGLTASLAYQGEISSLLAGSILGRDALILAIAIATRRNQLVASANKTGAQSPSFRHVFSLKRDDSHLAVNALVLSKLNTTLQLILLVSTLSHQAYALPTISTLDRLGSLVTFTTVTSGIAYVVQFFGRTRGI